MQPARRLDRIPPYLFADLDRKRDAARARGVDVIDLGVGDPDRPTPPHVVEALIRAAGDPETHGYPSYLGAADFRQAASRWLEERYGVRVNPDDELITLIGSKEGLSHFIWAMVDRDDVALVPDPAYPVYHNQVLLAGGRVEVMPLKAGNGFLPDLEAIPAAVAEQARVMFLNYPNNPTGATADLDFFERAVDFARRHDLVICHDAAYTELTFDGYRAPSILQVPGAREVAVEFHSLSKPYNMTGWRLGFAAGGSAIIEALGCVKTNTDSGQFTAVQRAGIAALLETPDSFHAELAAVYRHRRDTMIAALREAGVKVEPARATFYIWAPVPRGITSEDFCARVLEETGVLVSPGSAYGKHGEGYFRISLTIADDRLQEAAERLRGGAIFK